MNHKSIFYFPFFIFWSIVILFSIFYFLDSKIVFASTNIDSGSFNHWAWNDTIGWIDFYYTGSNINVSSAQLTGYASSSVGYIALDCATSPTQNCTYPYKVSNNASGNLSGWAWNDAIGWISFDSATAGSPYIYQVTISPSTGEFSGWAWNDIVGWISFNCLDINNCATSPNHKVKTNWRTVSATGNLISSIFDTQQTNGVAINTIMWQGSQPSGTSVKFQIASSNSSSGPWSYIGPDGSGNTYYTPTGPGFPVQINSAYHSNHRYYRYKAFLTSNTSQTESPRIDDVIINWSP